MHTSMDEIPIHKYTFIVSSAAILPAQVARWHMVNWQGSYTNPQKLAVFSEDVGLNFRMLNREILGENGPTAEEQHTNCK